MRIEVYRSGLIPQHVFESVSELLQDAFAEGREQGINFKCVLFSAQDVENEFVKRLGFMRIKPLSKMIYIILPYIRRIKKILR